MDGWSAMIATLPGAWGTPCSIDSCFGGRATITGPNNDIDRETTGEQYVEGDMETNEGVAPGGASIEDLDVSDDTPNSLAIDADDAADNMAVRGNDEAPDCAP
jgi:hypothetical protein